jgi:type IV pilus assembly protein PilB
MSKPLFGQLLGRHAPLSEHDIEEIRHEQQRTSLRFGDAALMLGLVTPEHVLQAWVEQLALAPEPIDLDEAGVDAQSTAHLPAPLVWKHAALPIRVIGSVLVVAVERPLEPAAIDELSRTSGMSIRQAIAGHAELLGAIDRYFPRDDEPRTEAA